MANLSKIIKITRADYNTIANGGSIQKGGVTYTYDNTAMYLVDDGIDYVTSSQVTNMLTAALQGYYPTTNPSGYTSNVGTVTSVCSQSPSSGNVSLTHENIGAGNLTIGDGANYQLFRTNATWASGMYYHTTGDESLVFGNTNTRTSWIFAYTNPTNKTDWTALTPSLQIKNGKVAINKLIANSAQGSYNLDVNGTANATTLYENGTALSSKYLQKSKITITSDGVLTIDIT